MISWLCIVIVSFVLGFFILGPVMYPKKRREPCRCFAMRQVLEVYADNQGTGLIAVWTGEGPPDLVIGPRHTYKERCSRCGQVQLNVGTFPPPPEKSFS